MRYSSSGTHPLVLIPGRTFPIKWEFDKMGIWVPKNLQSSSRWNGNSIKWEGCSAFCSKLEIYTKFRNSKLSNFENVENVEFMDFAETYAVRWLPFGAALFQFAASRKLSKLVFSTSLFLDCCRPPKFMIEFSKFQILNFQIWASFLSNTWTFGPNVWQMGFSEKFAVWFAIKWEFDKMGIFCVFRYNES